jgi:hypothetical protein
LPLVAMRKSHQGSPTTSTRKSAKVYRISGIPGPLYSQHCASS